MNFDVIIVGGGVIGLSVADRLSRAGRRVVLLERAQCGMEASWAAAGVLTPCSWGRKDELARMHMDALMEYHAFAGDIHERSGIDPEYDRTGALKPIFDENRLRMAHREVERIRDRRTPDGNTVVATLSHNEAAALEPELAVPPLGAQHCRLTAAIRSPRLLRGLQVVCERGGVEIREGVCARSFLKEGSRVIGVQTDGETYYAGHTIVAAGSWSSELDAALLAQTPVYPVRGQILLLRMEPVPVKHVIEVVEEKFYILVRRDGHVLIGSTEEHDSGYNTRTTAVGVSRLARLATQHVPILSQASLVHAWAGLRPGTPDRRPFIGFVPGLENVLAATGHFRTGLVFAPVTAKIITDLLDRGSCSYDLKKCAPARAYPPQANFAHLPPTPDAPWAGNPSQ